MILVSSILHWVHTRRRAAGPVVALLLGLCTVLAVTWAPPAGAEAALFAPRVEAERMQDQWLGGFLQYCRQPDNVTWTPDQAVSHCVWQRSEGEVPGVGITRGVFWLALPLKLSDQPAQRWLLQLAYPILHQVDFFVYQHGRLLTDYRTRVEEGGGLLRNRHFVLPLSGLRQQVDVVVRVESSGSIQFPLRIMAEPQFIAQDSHSLLLVGGAIGVMLAMLFYNFFIAVTNRNWAYFHYAGMVATLMLVQLTIQGLGPRFLWGDRVLWNAQVLPVAIGLSVFFANAFCDEFLQLERQQDSLRRGYRLIRWLALVLLITLVFFPADEVTLAGVTLVVIGSIYTIVLVVRHYESGDRAIQYFCLGWFFFLLGVLLFSFNKLGWYPRTFWSEHLMLIGTLIELLMLSLAMGERINQERTLKELAQARAMTLERKEREAHATTLRHEGLTRKAQEIALNLQKENNALLERKVEERNRSLEDLNVRLLDLTRQDPLTGVRNRRFLNERLPEEHARACREGSPLSVIMVDVDHFKQINDQFGHLVGDDCLKGVADLLDRLVVGPGAVVTRYGGEEFCLLLPYADVATVKSLADDICRAVANERWQWRGRTLRITVSVGGATSLPQRGEKPETLLDRADKALYEAKRGGRNCACMAAPVEALA